MPNRNKRGQREIGPQDKGLSIWQKKMIDDQERRDRLQKVLEKRRAKSIEDPKDIPNNAENENSKK